MSDARESDPIGSRRTAVVQKERAYRLLLVVSVAVTVVVTAGIALSLLERTIVFFTQVPPSDFFLGTDFSPNINQTFGVLPLVSGTLIVTVGSAAIALPIGLAAAIYLSEYASDRTREIIKPGLEILAGVPTVVYGYFALVYITPFLQVFVPQLRTFNALSASIVVGIMIIPMVSSISEDSLNAVPDSLRQAAYGLGSTKFDVSTKVVVPAGISGVISSYVLALSRAIGETMAVVMAAGQSPKLPFFPNVARNFTDSIETMTAAMVEIATADTLGQTAAYEGMFAIGLTLFAMTFTMNLVAEWIRQRVREVYE